MTDQAATPTGGAEVSARPQEAQAPTSVHDRLKAHLFAPEPKQPVAPQMGEADESEAPATEAVAPQETEQVEETNQIESEEGVQEEEAEANFQSLNELAEGLGWDLDKILDLEASTKIDGKEGKARLRDLIKSHQLEGHLNQKLMTFAEEKKGFEAETARKVSEIQQRVQQLNSAVTMAQKILDGEFADVNWQELQRTDPLEFQAKYGAYKMRADGIAQLAQQVRQEQAQVEAQQQAAQKAHLAEQAKLLDSKLPEWADKSKREKDVAEMSRTLSEAYGITEQELKSYTDHRHILLARDAWKWQQLQKQKPTVTNKVKSAPKLLKPGTSQSKAAVSNLQLQQDRSRLKNTGKVSDAKPILKKLLFG